MGTKVQVVAERQVAVNTSKGEKDEAIVGTKAQVEAGEAASWGEHFQGGERESKVMQIIGEQYLFSSKCIIVISQCPNEM